MEEKKSWYCQKSSGFSKTVLENWHPEAHLNGVGTGQNMGSRSCPTQTRLVAEMLRTINRLWTCFWDRSCWEGKWANDRYAARKRQIFGASSSKGPAERRSGSLRAQQCGNTLASFLKMVGLTAPSDIFKFLVKRAKLQRRSDMQIDVMENGVRF